MYSVEKKAFFTSTSIQTENSKAPFLKRVDHLWTKIYSVEKIAFFTSTSIQTESSIAPFLKRVDHLWTKIYSVEKKAFFASTSIQTESSKAPFCSKSEQKMARKTDQKSQAPVGVLLSFFYILNPSI